MHTLPLESVKRDKQRRWRGEKITRLHFYVLSKTLIELLWMRKQKRRKLPAQYECWKALNGDACVSNGISSHEIHPPFICVSFHFIIASILQLQRFQFSSLQWFDNLLDILCGKFHLLRKYCGWMFRILYHLTHFRYKLNGCWSRLNEISKKKERKKNECFFPLNIARCSEIFRISILYAESLMQLDYFFLLISSRTNFLFGWTVESSETNKRNEQVRKKFFIPYVNPN